MYEYICCTEREYRILFHTRLASHQQEREPPARPYRYPLLALARVCAARCKGRHRSVLCYLTCGITAWSFAYVLSFFALGAFRLRAAPSNVGISWLVARNFTSRPFLLIERGNNIRRISYYFATIQTSFTRCHWQFVQSEELLPPH